MITIKIGAVSRQFDNFEVIDDSWINQQVNGLRRDGQPVCVHVTINEGNIILVVATPACGGAGAGGRGPTAQESKIFDVWNDEKLNTPDITGGHVVAFFKRIRKLN